MIKNIAEFMKRRYIAVDLFDKKVRAFEKDKSIYIDKHIEEIYPDVLNIENQKCYWYDYNTIRELAAYVLKNSKKSFFYHILEVAYPYEFSELDKQRFVDDAILGAGRCTVFLVDNFLAAAVGSDVGIEEIKKKIFIYSIKNKTYIGLLFAGYAYNVNILEKGYDELTEIDIKNSTEKLLNEVSVEEILETCKNIEVLNKDLEKIYMQLKSEIERKIYLSVPKQLENKFDIGMYELIYLKYDDIIMEGLKGNLDWIKNFIEKKK